LFSVACDLGLPSPQQRATEWAYNLQFGCERYSTEEDLFLFAAVLAGRADELLWRQADLLFEMYDPPHAFAL
jgi:hypothetical protein